MLQAARASGIDFLEIARYNDETGTAPIPTGYSEVVFGEVFRAVGLAARRGHDRHEAVVGVLARADGGAGARRVAGAHGPRPLRLRLLRPAAARPADGRGRERGRRAGRRAAGCARGASSTGRPSASPRPAARARAGRRRRRAPRSCPTASSRATGSRAREMTDALLAAARGSSPPTCWPAGPERQVRRRAPAAGWPARSTTRAGRAPCGRPASSGTRRRGRHDAGRAGDRLRAHELRSRPSSSAPPRPSRSART